MHSNTNKMVKKLLMQNQFFVNYLQVTIRIPKIRRGKE